MTFKTLINLSLRPSGLLTEISIPYGSADVFFALEADELVFLKGRKRPRMDNCSWEASLEAIGPPRDIEIGIDAKLLLEDSLPNCVMGLLESLRGGGFSVRSRILGPKGLKPLLGDETLGRLSTTNVDTMPEARRLDLIVGLFTSFVFLDSLRLIGPVAFTKGSDQLLHCLRAYAGAGEMEALSILMNSLDAYGTGFPLVIALKEQEGAFTPHILNGEKPFLDAVSKWRTEATLTLPTGTNCLFGSLGGQPNDLVPSLGIPYLVEIANELDLEAMAFAAIWKHSAVDIPLLLSIMSSSKEMESRLRQGFLWENVVLYLTNTMKTGKRVRMLTSMHPLLVEKILGWRATSSAAETIGSLRRTLNSKLKLCAIGDLTSNRPMTVLDSGK